MRISNTSRQWLNRVRWILWLAALGWLLYVLAANRDPSAADTWSSIISGLVVLSTPFIGTPERTIKVSAEEVLPTLRHSMAEYWTEERRRRGLASDELIPVTLVDDSGTVRMSAPAGAAAWPFDNYAQTVATLIEGTRRALICGEAGSGKTTLAVMLANGLAAREDLVPLYLSLASWSPQEETFTRWFDRQASITYRCLRQVRVEGSSLLRQLLLTRKVVLVLDSLDEIRRGATRDGALRQISDVIDHDLPVVVLTRGTTPLPSLERSVRLHIKLLDVPAVSDYLDVRTASLPAGSLGPWNAVRAAAGTASAVRYLLARPLYLDLLLRTGLSRAGVPARFLAAAAVHGVGAGQRVLYEAYVDDALAMRRTTVDGQDSWFRQLVTDRQVRRAKRLAVGLAQEMSAPATATWTMGWWRLYRRVPPAMFGLAAGVVTAPAYGLCLLMPPGLTRGFALGTVAGVVLGMCRGVRTRSAGAIAASVVCSSSAVLAVGTMWVGWRTSAMDAVEIALAVALVFLLKTELTDTTWWHSALVVAGASIGTAVPTWAMAQLLGPQVTPPRQLDTVAFAVCMGLGVAVFSARWLSTPADALCPASAAFRPHGRPYSHIAAAMTAATAVGGAGGFVGGYSHNASHGVHVAVFFGIIIGPAIGLAAGLIKWLNEPAQDPMATAQRIYGHDRALAAWSVLAVMAAATGALAFMNAFFAPLLASLDDDAFHPHPAEGVLFGVTLGVIVAAFNTAWPNYAVCMVWFSMRRRIPWSLLRYLDHLHECGILRQEGPQYSYRARELQQHLASP
ncbi:NACHT domain-containing protein [Streptomyces sp. NPDC056660]|uniref:NACHT domain-containing protein n=1 Tax=Streptomyces sp. NPDC056660 TaxID=3345897 RepID=UPI00369ED779